MFRFRYFRPAFVQMGHHMAKNNKQNHQALNRVQLIISYLFVLFCGYSLGYHSFPLRYIC